MPLFEYKLETSEGEIITDVVNSSSKEDAAQLLKDRGRVLWVKERHKQEDILAGFFSVSIAEKATFCRHLATMLKAGLSLNRSLSILVEETENKQLQNALEESLYGLQKGASFSDELSRFPNVFDEVFIAVVRAGEESGNLEKAFSYLSTQLLSQHELSQKVKGALTYPAVVLTAMIGVGIAMMTFVIPKIGKVFSSMKIDVPFTTQLLLNVSTFLGSHVLLVILFFVGSLVGLLISLKLNSTRRVFINLVSKLPILNKLFQQLDLARFSRTLSLLLQSGVPIIEALEASGQTLSQNKYQKFVGQFEGEIKKGKSMSTILEESGGVFPSIMTQTIKAGEESGALDQVLMDLAEFYDEEVENDLKRFVSLLEPALMLVIGVAVAGMVISILAPIYSVVGNLQGQVNQGI